MTGAGAPLEGRRSIEENDALRMGDGALLKGGGVLPRGTVFF